MPNQDAPLEHQYRNTVLAHSEYTSYCHGLTYHECSTRHAVYTAADTFTVAAMQHFSTHSTHLRPIIITVNDQI